jgi:hypothetical protein
MAPRRRFRSFPDAENRYASVTVNETALLLTLILAGHVVLIKILVVVM